MSKAALAQLQSKLQDISTTLVRMDALEAAGSLNQTQAELAYSGGFLQAVNALEAFIETAFDHILDGGPDYGSKATPLIAIQARLQDDASQIRRSLTHREDPYLDWLPLDRTVNRAKCFLREGKPFSNWTDDHKSKIKMVIIIRHAIAHASDHATKEFTEKVLRAAVLKPHERNPSGYLRSLLGGKGSNRRITAYLGHIAQAAQAIAP